jgi:hypothetical protein
MVIMITHFKYNELFYLYGVEDHIEDPVARAPCRSITHTAWARMWAQSVRRAGEETVYVAIVTGTAVENAATYAWKKQLLDRAAAAFAGETIKVRFKNQFARQIMLNVGHPFAGRPLPINEPRKLKFELRSHPSRR